MVTIDQKRTGPFMLRALFLATLLPVAGCSDLLSIEDVDVTEESQFVDETSIPALRASVQADFVDVYEDLILYTGLLGDEWVSSGTFGTRIEVDRRNIDPTNATIEPVFANLSRARAIADFVDQRFELVDPDGGATTARAEVRALGGLSLVLMAEAYCEGTPMSRFVQSENRFVYGGPLTRAQVLDSAQARFQAALDIAGAGSDQEYLAHLGNARVLLNEGDYAAAAAEVTGIPTDWVFLAGHDAQSGVNNTIWSFNISQERWSIPDVEGDVGLPYRSAADPRMVWVRSPSNDVGFDRRTPQYDALKYSDRPAYTVIGDGVEARLIEAEAALDGGDPDGMLTILNDLRSQVETLMASRNYDYVSQLDRSGFDATLAPLTLPATLAEQQDLLFQERAYWLWLTSHRLGDMRRLVRQYGRAVDAVFPTGLYAPNGNAKGGSYGPDVNFPIPVPEQNNPEDGAGECLNRNA